MKKAKNGVSVTLIDFKGKERVSQGKVILIRL